MQLVQADLVIGLRELAPADRDVHCVPPGELVLPLACIKATSAGAAGVHHHLPACLPLSYLTQSETDHFGQKRLLSLPFFLALQTSP